MNRLGVCFFSVARMSIGYEKEEARSPEALGLGWRALGGVGCSWWKRKEVRVRGCWKSGAKDLVLSCLIAFKGSWGDQDIWNRVVGRWLQDLEEGHRG